MKSSTRYILSAAVWWCLGAASLLVSGNLHSQTILKRTDAASAVLPSESDLQSADATQFDESLLNTLAADPDWLRLVHLKLTDDQWQSDIKSPDFFLSEDPTPVSELKATLAAFSQPADDDEAHAMCRFPARYRWLSTQLKNLEAVPQPECAQFTSWLSPIKNEPVQVVHVSGFFGNPASAFGHLLLRIGRSDELHTRGLLNLGINFGARIPGQESAVSYMFKGLFGGYEATFTDKQHYLQDHIYSAVESRDMWTYQLNLTDQQRLLLLSHLWELKQVHFSYYFLLTNCAYRIAELLELALDQPFTQGLRTHYLPVDVFYRLDELDREQYNGQLIQNIGFIPSRKRELENKLSQLDSQQPALISKIIKEGSTEPYRSLLSPQVVDFLNDYIDYEITTSPTQQNRELGKLKDQLLLYLLNSDNNSISVKPNKQVTPLEAPGMGLRAGVIRVKLASDKQHNSWQQLTIAPFAFDLLDNNRGSLIDSSFRVLELQADNKEDTPELRRLELIGIEKWAPTSTLNQFSGGFNFNWRGSLAYEKKVACSSTCDQFNFTAGIGKSYRKGGFLLSGFLDGSVDVLSGDTAISVSAGSIYKATDKLRVFWQSSATADSTDSGTDVAHELSFRYRALRDHAIQLTLSEHSSVQLGYQWRW